MDKDYLWWRDGVIYQIYPRSFADGNQDGIGDISGIFDHLDYLEDLGVDAIWLSPIYPTPDVDFGYDVSDYKSIDPRFGSLSKFDRLVDELHKREIRIILDLVLNHTSDQHPWFQAARSSKNDPKRDWYIWKDPSSNGGAPNNWKSMVGGSAWEYDQLSGQYYYHMFYKEQPDLNWRNPQVRNAMLDVFRFWLNRGVDGFRLDVFNLFFKHPDFLDNPPKLGLRGFDRQYHVYDQDQPEMISLLGEIRNVLDKYSETYAVGEPFDADNAPKKAANYVGDGRLHAAFSFEFTHCKWKPGQFLRAVQRWENALLPEAWPNYVLNNHDVVRAATRYGKGEDDERLKVAAALLLTQRGTPFLYYGEEIGMRDIQLKKNEIKDPVGRYYWPVYKGRDGCRSPMQWNSEKNAGFSDVDPWLPVHQNYLKRNVAAQRKNPDSLYHFYKKLLKIRKEIPALRSGMMVPLTHEPRTILAYLRQLQDQKVLVALNFSKRSLRLFLSSQLANRKWKMLLSNQRQSTPELKQNRLSLAPNEACILLEIE